VLADPEGLGGLGLHAVVLVQGRLDRLALNLCKQVG